MDSVVQPEASVVQTGLGIKYVGEWSYAYSGGIGSSTSPQTMLSFTTGSGIICGTFVCFAQTNFSDPTTGGASNWQISLNSEVVTLQTLDTDNKDMPSQIWMKLILPPFTIVKLEVDSAETNPDELLTATFTGRVYGTE